MQVSDRDISVFPELCTLEECATNCDSMVGNIAVQLL